MRGNPYQSRVARLSAKAQSIWLQADSEGRNLTPTERAQIKRLVAEVEGMRAVGTQMDRVDPGLPGGEVTMTDPRSSHGDGWAKLARSLDVKSGKVKAEVPLAGLLRTKTQTEPNEGSTTYTSP